MVKLGRQYKNANPPMDLILIAEINLEQFKF